LIGSGGSSSAAAGSGLDVRSTNFANSILGEAVPAAVNSTAQQLESKASALPTKQVSIDGLIADAAPDGRW